MSDNTIQHEADVAEEYNSDLADLLTEYHERGLSFDLMEGEAEYVFREVRA